MAFKPSRIPEKEWSDKEQDYTVTWVEEHHSPMLATPMLHSYFFTGTKKDVAELVVLYLKRKNNLAHVEVMESSRYKHKQYEQGFDGHWHTVDGKVTIHTWDECPENPDYLPSREQLTDYIRQRI
jgi:hypothetical protein